MIKPIHKFNNGNGATLCNCCSKIIATGLTKDLYCSKKCYSMHTLYKQMDKEVHKNNSDLNK
jgi:hypothetical protein